MTLENKVEDKESKGFMRKALKLGYKLAVAGATTLLSTSLIGTTGVVAAGAFVVGSAIGGLVKRKSLYDIIDKSLSLYSTLNVVISPAIWLGDLTFPLIENLVYYAAPNQTLLARAAQALYSITAYNAAFVTMFKGTEHLIDNYFNPSGMIKAIKDNFYNTYFRIGMIFSPAYALVSWGTHTLNIGALKLSTFAANAPFAGFYNAVNPIPPKKETDIQWLNPFYILGGAGDLVKKTVTGITNSIVDVGSGIKDLYKAAPKPVAPTPALQPA